MKSRHLLIVLLVGILLGSVASCGKANGFSPENIDCGYRFIAGYDCIVCVRFIFEFEAWP